MDAWKAACQSDEGNASFVIPKGEFMVGQVEFGGPCHDQVSPKVEIRGKLKSLINDGDAKYWIKFYGLNRLSVSGGGELDGQGAQAWDDNKCEDTKSCKLSATSLRLHQVNNAEVYDLKLTNSKAFHMNLHKCDSIDIHDLEINAPGTSKNTDGIHLSITHNITIRNSVIGTGDDCISVGQGSRGVTIYNITCGPGHGISVGSLGKYADEMDVVDLVVKNCTIKGTTNGLRIKTWQGSLASQARNFTFEDVKMINVANPIIIDQKYCPGEDDYCSSKPSKVKINDVKFSRISGTSRTRLAVNILCSKDVPCSNIELDNIHLSCSSDDMDCKTTTASCTHAQGKVFGVQIPPPCL
ncbi:exopolygalacturonase-like [Canna indica]|uniref:Exopolygalacturonase n=1 Tax=Canna indica TaxID=4628 RepID=A0AAQ3JT87_9LILI|nr:exopolygalacturonase-like [Canna indica]